MQLKTVETGTKVNKLDEMLRYDLVRGHKHGMLAISNKIGKQMMG